MNAFAGKNTTRPSSSVHVLTHVQIFQSFNPDQGVSPSGPSPQCVSLVSIHRCRLGFVDPHDRSTTRMR